MAIIFFGLGTASIFNVFTFKDYKIIPTDRRYIITEELERKVSENSYSLEMITQIIDLRGTLDLRTTSRSAQNPITIEAELTPIPVFNVLDVKEVWSKMPDTLHFIFPTALVYPIQRDNFGQPEYAELILTKSDDPLRYNGQITLVYEDEGNYPFFLLESVEMFYQTVNGKITFQHEFSDEKAPLKTMIAEVNGGIGQINIGSYSQTTDIEQLKTQYYGIFFGLSVALFGFF